MTTRRMPPCPAEQARRHAEELRAIADRMEAEAERIEAIARGWNRAISQAFAGPPAHRFWGPGLSKAKK